ncbi:MAG TPA: hypothetical protein VGF94_16625 [Kofleriaceae bacterium]|jgi:hypothetical protein
MQNLSRDELARVTGGDSTSDAASALKRAQDQKAANAVDLYGYQTTTTNGIGAEYRRKLTPNVSLFANGHVGTSANKPDEGVSGGIRFEW